jgi:hypothetical protein
MPSVILTDEPRMTSYEDGLRHIEILAVPQSVHDPRFDLACRAARGGAYHYADERVAHDGPPTCLWCLADRRPLRRQGAVR